MTTSTGSKATTLPLDRVAPYSESGSGRRPLTQDNSRHRARRLAPSISLISPYKPIVCGIADYVDFLTESAPPAHWDVLSFDLGKYGVRLREEQPSASDNVWYGIPSRDGYSAASITRGLRPRADQVLWFQHEFGIWRDNARFISMMRDLDMPKAVSLHTLHFQSDETSYGLREEEYSFLRSLLPHVDAITAFSDGVYEAVARAFPEYGYKVHLLRHGTHLYPEFCRMAKAEAKATIHDYLVRKSALDEASRDNLRRQGVFLDPETVIIGGTGFITASKGTSLLYDAHRLLQQMLPDHKIAAVYVGQVREANSSIDSRAAADLKARHNGQDQFFLEAYLPREVLAAMLRALDLFFYWPTDCTQSGMIAHALGAGATIACRDMEGVGETVRMAGGLTSRDFKELVLKMRQAVVEPELRAEIAKRALLHAAEYSWRNQFLRHLEVAAELCLPHDRDSVGVERVPADLGR